MKRMIQLTMMACIAMMCVCFASCNDDVIVEVSQSYATGQPFRLTASQATPSRLALGEDGLSVMWEPGDKLYLVKKDRSTAPIELIADIEEAATEATFTSQSGVPAGEYHVVYNYNDNLVYEHVPLMSIDDINEQDKLALWGELTVSEGDTSAEVSLQHIYAKIRVVLENAPETDGFQIGMYASGKTGFPICRMLTGDGLVNANGSRNKFYETDHEKYHHISIFNAYYSNEICFEDIDNYSSLILPEDVSDGILFFYILDGNKCYEIAKNNVKFEAGKSYKITLNMSEGSAVITELIEQRILLPDGTMEYPCYQLSSPEEFRHAAYRKTGVGAYTLGCVLTDDIDFENEIYLPISASYIFGNDKTISNISLDWSNDDNVGFHRSESEYIDETYISNLTLENVSFKGNYYVGALGGRNIIAQNCNLTGNSIISGIDYIGGVVGYNEIGSIYWERYGGMLDINIEASCLIKGRNYVGGIIGCSTSIPLEFYFSFKLLESCVSSASITATGNCVGGILGRMGNGKYDGSCNYGFSTEGITFSLTNCINHGIVTGADYVGGIVGDFAVYTNAEGLDRVLIKQSSNDGNISGANYVGGIAGRTYASINTCYSINGISASGSYVGGIVGAHCNEKNNTCNRIANCYSLSGIVVENDEHVGGIVGCLKYYKDGYNGGIVQNSYFAGTNTTNNGIIGGYEGSCTISNCVTTLSSLGPNLDDTDIVSNSFVNVTSIYSKIDVLNSGGENAYSTNEDDIWEGNNYQAVKFASGLSGTIPAPGFGDSEIEI